MTDPEIDATPTPNWTHGLLEPDRRYFSVDLACVSFTVVARDEAHVRELMPEIWHMQICGGYCASKGIPQSECQETSYAEAQAEFGIGIEEISGETTIVDDGRDGNKHRIDTYPLGTWASSEY